MSVKHACVGLQRGADVPPLTPPQRRSLGHAALLACMALEAQLLVIFGSLHTHTHTFYFQAKISTLAFGPKRVVVDGWGMSLGMSTSPILWRRGERCASPLH